MTFSGINFFPKIVFSKIIFPNDCSPEIFFPEIQFPENEFPEKYFSGNYFLKINFPKILLHGRTLNYFAKVAHGFWMEPSEQLPIFSTNIHNSQPA